MGSVLRAVAVTCGPLLAAQLSAHVAPFGITSAVLIPFVTLAYPGMLFITPRKHLDWSYWAVVAAASAAILIAGITLARITGIYVSASDGWVFLWILVGIAWIARRRHLLALPAILGAGFASLAGWRRLLFLGGFLMAFASARWVVPPQQDQDMVIANPTYGYLQHGKPYGTETHFAYIFSKPPLLHLQAGFTLLLIDRLEQASFYWQSGRIVEILGEPRWATRRFRQKDVECFELHPELVRGTRLLTTFYAALVPGLIADLALLLGGSPAAATIAGLSYLLIPEVFVRSGYAGFTTPSTAVLALSAILVHGPAPTSSRIAAGILMALLNQKMLFVPAAYAAWKALSRCGGGIRRVVRDPWLWGAFVGTAVWWVYGATVDWSTFLRDHFYYDFRDRFLFQDLSIGLRGVGWYPGVGGLWQEWARNLSPPLLAMGMAGVVWGLFQGGALRFLSLWALLGWVLGSVTDWRQTKHLMLTIVPMAVTAQLLAERYPRWHRVLMYALIATALYTGVRIVQLWRDFDSLLPSTVW